MHKIWRGANRSRSQLTSELRTADESIPETPTTSGGSGVEITEDAQWTKRIRRYCAERQLAGFKQPRRVFRMHGALPRNSSGKVLKHEIIRLCASLSKEANRL